MKQYPGEIDVIRSAVLAYKDYINKSAGILSSLLDITDKLYVFDLKTSNFIVKDKAIYKEINDFSKEAAEFLSLNMEYFKKHPEYNIKILEKIITYLLYIPKIDVSKEDINTYIYKTYEFMKEFSASAVENSSNKKDPVSENAKKEVFSILNNLDKLNSVIKKRFSQVLNSKASIDDLKKDSQNLIEYIEEIDSLKCMISYRQDLTKILVYCYKISNINYPKNNPKDAIYYIDYYISHIHKLVNLAFFPSPPLY